MSLENITMDELKIALDGSAEELYQSLKDVEKNYQVVLAGARKLENDNAEMTKVSEQVAQNCLDLTQTVKHLYSFLSANQDKLEGTKGFKQIMDGLATFTLGSSAIKAGVIANAE